MFLLSSEKVNGLVLIILFLISFHMIVLVPPFSSLSCLCLLYIYPGLMRRHYLVPAWKQAMDEEIDALVSQENWDLVFTPKRAVVVGCHWVYTLKYYPNRSVDR